MARARILLVETEREFREFLARLLMEEGYPVTTFDDPEDAIVHAAASTTRVVLLFGSIHPFAAVRARREAELGHVGVILTTGAFPWSTPALPGVEVLKKPYTMERLFAACEKAA